MACTTTSPLLGTAGLPPAMGRPMTRCECADVSFEEAARRMAAERLSLEQAVRKSGCAMTCGACLPDLVRHLDACALAAAASRR